MGKEGNTIINDALDYFKGDAGHRRLFSLFKKKYESLGRIGGSVKIDVFTDKELSSVARFFGKTSAELRQKGKISLEQFEQQIGHTRFQGIDLKQLLEAYFNHPLVSKKEARQVKERQQTERIGQLIREYPPLTFWFRYLLEKTPDTYWIYRLMDENDENFVKDAGLLAKAFAQLPQSFERLPMFSQRITRNPHAFDRNTNLGKLWIHVLAVHEQEKSQALIPSDSESINDLLLNYNILRDDITNFVTCVNLVAETNQGPHSMWEAAAKTTSVMNVPLRELISVESVYPFDGKKTVWIVENSGVYSSILDKLPHVALICTHGQFKLAALWLLDLLVEAGCTLYYAGDFDPEGLSMASRLLERYPDHVKLWKMDLESYHDAEAAVDLPEERIHKLDSIKTPVLQSVIEQMKKRKKAGYQEALVEQMIYELAEHNS